MITRMMRVRFRPAYAALLVATLRTTAVASLVIASTTAAVDQAHAATVTVTSTADSGPGSLRNTLADAASGDTVVFDSALSGQIIRLTSTLLLPDGITVDGSDLAEQVTLSGDSNDDGTGDVVVFNVLSDAAAILDSLTITEGATDLPAVGNYGDLTIRNSTIADNPDGGMYNDGTLTVEGCTFSGNSNDYRGGAIRNTADGTLSVANSTFVSNSAESGGAISSLGIVSVYNSTFLDNSCSSVGCSITIEQGTLHIANNVMAPYISECVNGGTIATNVGNWITGGNCSPAFTGDPKLRTLADNGGPTLTVHPQALSPLINAGNDAACLAAPVSGIDQRGLVRPLGSHCDIGAVEVEPFLVVTKAADTNDGVCNDDCSLREAIHRANALAGADVIHFDDDYTIVVGSALPTSSGDLTIDGQTNAIVIDANELSLLTVSAGTTVVLSDLAIQDAKGGDNRAIDSQGDLTLQRCTVSNPSLSGGGTISNDGGFLRILESVFDAAVTAAGTRPAVTSFGGELEVDASTFSNNTSSGGGAILAASLATITDTAFLDNSYSDGGAIQCFSASADVTILGSYFAGNSASVGAAIRHDNGDLTVANSTFDGNTASGNGTIIAYSGTVTLANTTFWGNSHGLVIGFTTTAVHLSNNILGGSTVGTDCAAFSPITTNVSNLIADGTCSPALSGDPKLVLPAALHGGPTKSFALLSDSPALEAGDDATCAVDPVGGVDQRGATRPFGDHCDIGAFELAPVCGNSSVEGDEECDDGNDDDGDCCSSTCDYEAAASPCAVDAVACTIDACDGAGTCVHTADDSACNDGDLCTQDICDEGTGCISDGAQPAAVCSNDAPGKASLSISNPTDATKKSVQLKWSNGSFSFADLGDPENTTAYALCVYDADGSVVSLNVPAGGNCNGKPCWSTSGNPPSGIKYKDATKPPVSDGVSGISAKSSTLGKGKLQVKASGSSVPDISLDALSYPITAQVVTSDAGCWEIELGLDDEKKNDGVQYKAAHKAP